MEPPILLLDEVIFEILSWLHVKSLIRLRSVCKLWKSFISDPSFIKLHLERSSKKANFLEVASKSGKYVYVQPCTMRSLFENPTSLVTTTDPSCRLNTDKYIVVVGSCNGLVCLQKFIFSSDVVIGFRVSFWNPATRLRSKKSASLLVKYKSYSLPPGTNSVLGFGYDNINNTYKVVLVFHDDDSEHSQVKVYSMGEDGWRDIQSLPVVLPLNSPNGEYLSGTLNWIAFSNSNSCRQVVIVSLDLGKETYTQSLLPYAFDEVTLDDNILVFLGVLMDRLCISYDSYKEPNFVIWQMKEFGVEKSWTQLVKVSYQDLGFDCMPRELLPSPLHICENGDVLITLIYCGKLQAILYNQKDNRVVERAKYPDNIEWICEMDYSLVSPL